MAAPKNKSGIADADEVEIAVVPVVFLTLSTYLQHT